MLKGGCVKKSRLWRRFLTGCLTLGLLLGAAACGRSPESAGGAGAADEREVVFAASRDQAPGEQDAYYCGMDLGIWEPLITKDEQGHPVPALAALWTHNDNADEWTFKLREGVKFSNGVPLTADLVRQNFDRYAKGPFESDFYGIEFESMYPGFQTFVVEDDHTFKLTFDRSLPLLDYLMADYNSCIFEPSCFAEDGTFKEPAIGTGPFVLSENVLGEYCVIQRNAAYSGQPAKVNRIRFKVIPDPDTRYAALRSGEVHGLCDLGAITPALAAEIQSDPAYRVLTGKSEISHYLNVNGNRFPFDSQKMREGLSLFLNRDEILREFYNGYGTPAGSFLNHSSAFYKAIPVQHDEARGKELMMAALGDRQADLELIVPSVDANRYPYEETALYIQARLKTLGINCHIIKMEWGAAREKMRAQDYDLCLKIQGLPSADPFDLFEGFMSDDGWANTGYGLGYHSDAVESLLAAVPNCKTVDEIKPIYDRLQDIAAEDFPNIPIAYAEELAACTAKIKGYEPTSFRLKGFTEVEWTD